MQLARVVGSLVSTRKSDKLHGMKILVAVPVDMDTFEEKGAPFVTIDAIGAGEGEVVMCVGGSSSRQTEMTEGKPVDNTIVAIIDSVDVLGRRLFDKAGDMRQEAEKPEPQVREEEVVMVEEATVEAHEIPQITEVAETIVVEKPEAVAERDNSFERVRESRRERSKKKNK
ncbi:MAG: EutN/CcmL family microcompartment protein [Christensenella sp.]|uniref:EutN/CcmL family microcompartment protein n=1 Tax=Christensenella sp. TaxID=1935934 RepID=UPI002B210809|nr:EutN/CcmL family microcompartment protein [Christensenella sp.]MEA5002082.1 EutN/CcmL family microcompartment protein [Christensenella sp.]